MKATLVILAAAAAFAAGTVNAQSNAAELKAKGCLGCHESDKKKVGPAIKDIAAKYKGDKGAVDKIVAKMTSGKGHPKTKVSEEDAKKLVADMLGAK